jgi:hypothetical protein
MVATNLKALPLLKKAKVWNTFGSTPTLLEVNHPETISGSVDEEVVLANAAMVDE